PHEAGALFHSPRSASSNCGFCASSFKERQNSGPFLPSSCARMSAASSALGALAMDESAMKFFGAPEGAVLPHDEVLVPQPQPPPQPVPCAGAAGAALSKRISSRTIFFIRLIQQSE